MSKLSLQKVNVIGIAVRTTNENGQSSQDIPALWNRFMSEGFTTDFEVYGAKARNSDNAEIDIFIAIK